MKNQTSENRREFIREASKIVREWNVYLEIFSRLLRTDILQKTVVGCPWLNNVKFRKRRVPSFLGSVATMSNPDRFRNIFPNRRPIFANGQP